MLDICQLIYDSFQDIPQITWVKLLLEKPLYGLYPISLDQYSVEADSEDDLDYIGEVLAKEGFLVEDK